MAMAVVAMATMLIAGRAQKIGVHYAFELFELGALVAAIACEQASFEESLQSST